MVYKKFVNFNFLVLNMQQCNFQCSSNFACIGEGMIHHSLSQQIGKSCYVCLFVLLYYYIFSLVSKRKLVVRKRARSKTVKIEWKNNSLENSRISCFGICMSMSLNLWGLSSSHLSSSHLSVVYFDQQTGAPNAVCWLKLIFWR